MKTLTFLFVATMSVVLVASTPLEADDDTSLLDKLSRETARVTMSADRHTVRVSMGGAHWHTGVLMGSKPWVVTPFAQMPAASMARAYFEHGTQANAKRVFGDAELGVAVYELGDGAPEGLTGLDVHEAWDFQRGQLVVAGAGSPTLALIDGVDRVAGRLRAGKTPPGALLLDTRGRVVGLGGSGGMANCATCHAPSVNVNQANPSLAYSLVGHADTVTVNSPDGTIYGYSDKDGRILWKQLNPHAQLVTGYVARGDYTLAQAANLHFADPHKRTIHPGHYVAGPVLERVLADLDQYGRVRYAYLGVVPGQMVFEQSQRGVKLDTVLEGSPAANVGLKKGDVLVSIDGHPCRDPGTVGRVLVQKRPGESVTLDVIRLEKPVRTTLGDRGEARAAHVTPDDVGMTVVDLDDSLRTYLGLADNVVGVVVMNVKPGSAAQRTGLQRGDVIVKGAGGPVRDVPELEAVIATSKKTVLFTATRRMRGEFQVTLTLPPVKHKAR